MNTGGILIRWYINMKKYESTGNYITDEDIITIWRLIIFKKINIGYHEL
jgi:hypothetical protein